MSQGIRSYAAAGAAIAVAGAVAVAPAPSYALPDRALASASPAIQLTTTADPFLAWVEVFNNSEVNFADLSQQYLEAPFPVVQQVIVNWYNYIQLFPDIATILADISQNVTALIDNQIAAQPGNLTGFHGLMYSAIVELVPAELKPVIDYTTNFNSGMVVGALGPLVSPVLALSDQLTEFVDELFGGDFTKAINALVNIPAAMTGAFLNGHGILDLTFLAGLIPPQQDIKIEELGLAMGGLLTPAGSLFNSLDLLVELGDNPLPVPGVKAGLIGSWFAANQSSAEAIGWDGKGNPLAALLTDSEEDEEEAPAAASTALAAADTVSASVPDADSTAPSVDLASDVSDADVESDGSETDLSTTDSDTAETGGDADSDSGADGESDSDVDGDSDVDVDVDGDSESDADGESDADADADSGSGDDSDSDADSGSDSSTASD